MQRVAIIQRVLPHYRIQFFDELYQHLAANGIALTVYYGREYPGTVPKTTLVTAAWGKEIGNRYWSLAGREIVWQSVPHEVWAADMTIVEQAVRFPLNFRLQARRLYGAQKLAFWGHGRNYQAHNARGLTEAIKRMLICAVDWWFAYTDLSARDVASAGFPRERITIVNNTIDSESLLTAMARVTPAQIELVRVQQGLIGTTVGLYCGGMYPDKRLPFLMDAIKRIKARVPDFEMLFIGDGPDAPLVKQAAESLPWVRYLGPLYDDARAVYLSMARIMLMPGLVGLAIIDAFVAGTPLATTAIDFHSPEIAYLKHGVNGLISADGIDQYADMVVNYFADSAGAEILISGCQQAAAELTLATMVANFSQGVMACLGRP